MRPPDNAREALTSQADSNVRLSSPVTPTEVNPHPTYRARRRFTAATWYLCGACIRGIPHVTVHDDAFGTELPSLATGYSYAATTLVFYLDDGTMLSFSRTSTNHAPIIFHAWIPLWAPFPAILHAGLVTPKVQYLENLGLRPSSPHSFPVCG